MDDKQQVGIWVERLEVEVIKTLSMASSEWILTCPVRIWQRIWQRDILHNLQSMQRNGCRESNYFRYNQEEKQCEAYHYQEPPDNTVHSKSLERR